MPTGPKPPLAPGMAKIVLSGVNGPAEWANILYGHPETTSGDVTTADLDTIVDGYAAAYHTHLMGAMVTQCEMLEGKGVYIPTSGSEVVSTRTYTYTGSDTSAPQPANVSAVLSWAISAYYRGGHPRTYLPGIGADVINDTRTFKTSFVSGLATAAEDFRVAINALTSSHISQWNFIVVSFASHNEWRETPVAYDINGVSVHPRIDSQRRRLGKETT